MAYGIEKTQASRKSKRLAPNNLFSCEKYLF